MSTVPDGSLSNAALVGAKTVNGPLPCSVSIRPAAFTAATSVVWSFELTAFSMMFFVGNMAAPPTITDFSLAASPALKPAAMAMAQITLRYMSDLLWRLCASVRSTDRLVARIGRRGALQRPEPYQPSTSAKMSGATIVASDSITNFGVVAASFSHVIFSLGIAPEYEP